MIRSSPRGLLAAATLVTLVLLFLLSSHSTALDNIPVPQVKVEWGEWTRVLGGNPTASASIDNSNDIVPDEEKEEDDRLLPAPAEPGFPEESETGDIDGPDSVLEAESEPAPSEEKVDDQVGSDEWEGSIQGESPGADGELSGVGEGKEFEDGLEEGYVDGSTRPCRRTFMIHLKGERGFGSEFSRFTRMAAVAEHFGYEVIVSHYSWMYGHFEQYFKIPERKCKIKGVPGDSSAERPRIKVTSLSDGKPWWTQYDHVQDGTDSNFDYIDELFLSFATKAEPLNRLHELEVERYPPKLPLTGGQTIPKEMLNAFTILSEITRKWWVLNKETQAMVDALRKELKWNEEAKEDLSIIGMHIRLGDKCQEMANPNNGPLRFASPEVLKEKKSHAHCQTGTSKSELDSSVALTYLTATDTAISDLPQKKNTILAIMSDDSLVLQKLEDSAGTVERDYDTILLPDVGKKVPQAMGMSGGRDIDTLKNGFSGQKYSDLSYKTRVALGRRFIRDLTLLAEDADALIFTGSSNVGRLMALLGGPEKALAGSLISCDTRWYPTSHYS